MVVVVHGSEIVILGSYLLLFERTSCFLMNTTRRSIILSSRVGSLFLVFLQSLIPYALACALGQDLALLPQNDLTEVGEKGKSNSTERRIFISPIIHRYYCMYRARLPFLLVALIVTSVVKWRTARTDSIGSRCICESGPVRFKLLAIIAKTNCANRVLLDDCLAAVDSHVARHIFSPCVYLWYSRFLTDPFSECYWPSRFIGHQSANSCDEQYCLR